MSGRTRPRARLRRSLFGLTALSAAVLAAFSLMVAPAANAGTSAAAHPGRSASRAAARSASTATARPAGTAGSGTSVSSGPVISAPSKRVCATPSKPGYAYCDALVRTDAPGHQGQLAAGVTPLGYGPADLQGAYALPSATAGAGATVALVEVGDDPTAEQDLAEYRSQYGLPACTTANGCFRKINQDGGSLPPAIDTGWALETSLDMDMVSAICPKCHILLVEADDEGTVQDVGTAENEAVAQGAKYISNSYTISAENSNGYFIENPDELQWDSEYFNHPGVVITASAGDDGYLGATPFPADSPHVVAVGGTTLTRDPSTARGWDETVWGDMDPASGDWEGTGSGCSLYEPKPSWQTDTGCPGRTMNDVAAVANPATGVAVYDSAGGYGGWTELGGTSASAPIIASVYALAGRPVATTYPASYLYANPSALNNVTSGTNSQYGTCGNYPAYICNGEPGYNGPTGLGTPEGVAAFQAGPHGAVTGTVRDNQGRPLAGVTVSIASGSAVTNAQGRFATTALDGSYTATATEFGYASQSAAITVASGTTATAAFTLTKYPIATVSGTVTDASGHGWPLYAQVQVAGTSVNTYTNPVTGRYQITLPVTGSAYTLDTSAVYPGYQAGTATVTPVTAGVSQDFGLTVDPLTNCDAPGYKPVYDGYRQTFSTGAKPAGWTVSGWSFNDPGHVGNYTGGSGGFAYDDPGNNQMITQPIDLSGDQDPVLQFDTDMQINGGGEEVWVSDNGGTYEYNVWTSDPNGDDPTLSIPGPATVTVPLPSQMAGQPDVQVFFDGGPFWEVDNVFVGDLSCVPVAGGMVVGQVSDRNTGQPVNGAQVSLSGSSTTVTSEPEPDDPAVGGGLYWMFSPAGSQTLTASASSLGFSPASAGVTVATGAVTQADFDLDAPRVAMSPGSIAGTAAMGSGTATEHLTVANTGSASATVSLDPQQGQVTVSGQPGGVAAGTARAAGTAHAAAGAPLRTVAGNFGPGLPGKAGGPPAKASARPAGTGPAPSGGGSDTSWVPITHFPENGYDAAAAEDPATGLVYLAGGVIDITSTNQAWVFNPRTGTWSQLPSMTYGREAPAAAFINGKLYVTAGYDSVDNVTQQALEIYDPRTGLWSQGAPIPHAFYGSATAVLDGKMYVIGGCNAANECPYRDVQVYDPATNTWTQAASYPRTIAFASCGGIGGELYCAGGFDHDLGSGTAAADVYDPQSNAWTAIASMPTDLWGSAYSAANGQLLVSGGVTRVDDELTNQGFAYNPATGAWSALPNAADTVYRGASACGMYQIGGVVDNVGDETDTAQQLPGYGDCGGSAQAPWLSLSQDQLTLAPGQRATVTVTLNAADPSVSQPGTYPATLFADATTPYLGPSVNATLTATPPRTWGELAGTVEGKACHGATAPLAGVAIQVGSAAGSWTLTTDSNGQYALWLDASDSPLSLIATDPDWQAQTATANLTARKTTTVNFTLSPAGC
jgi:N-acetylneuraminic acid mutarotase